MGPVQNLKRSALQACTKEENFILNDRIPMFLPQSEHTPQSGLLVFEVMDLHPDRGANKSNPGVFLEFTA